MMMVTLLMIRNGFKFKIAVKMKLVDVKSPEQSTENKAKASSTASQFTNQTAKSVAPMITGIENQEDFTSIMKQAIGDEHYQTKLMNDAISKVYVSRDYTYRILTNSLKPITYLGSHMKANGKEILKLLRIYITLTN
jgi:hypothetical protein